MKKSINQKQLRELLKLPPNVIRHLKDVNILKWKKVGRQHFFDEESIRQFQQTFNRDDYLTKGECVEKLRRYGFYSDKIYKGFYHNNINIYITVVKLIDGTDDIPNKFRLERIKFGVTEYISKHSFAVTLNWLRNYNHKVNPIRKPFVFDNTDVKSKKSKLKSMGKREKVTTIRLPTPTIGKGKGFQINPTLWNTLKVFFN